MLLVCYSLLHSQNTSSITVKKVAYRNIFGDQKKPAEVTQEKRQ